MSSTIGLRANMDELQALQRENKDLRKRIKKNKDRINVLKSNTLLCVTSNNQPGFKYKNKAFIKIKKSKTIHKSMNDKNIDCLKILRKNGVKNPAELLLMLLEARKGQKIQVNDLKIKQIKK